MPLGRRKDGFRSERDEVPEENLHAKRKTDTLEFRQRRSPQGEGNIGICASCGEPIADGQQYVRVFVINGKPMHLECWLSDHDMTIVAIGLRKTADGKVVICESEADLAKRLPRF